MDRSRRNSIEHEHDFYRHGQFDHAPVSDGHHTSFLMLRCYCGAIDVFPRSNYNLTTQEFRMEFLRELRSLGQHLIEEPR